MTPPRTGRTMLDRRTWLPPPPEAPSAAAAPKLLPVALPRFILSTAAVRLAHCCRSFSYFCLASRRFFSSWPMRWSFRWIFLSFSSASTLRPLFCATSLWYQTVSCSIFRSSTGTLRARGRSEFRVRSSESAPPTPAVALFAGLGASASRGLPSTVGDEDTARNSSSSCIRVCLSCISSFRSFRRLSTSWHVSFRSYSTFSRSILASIIWLCSSRFSSL
mmetsp:Transcript_65031/g.190245  ORF Transcript_65031/g.190245 Transcript_65031/m.190245 type:complete len:219 (+) Transcript_65031:248-904(+)